MNDKQLETLVKMMIERLERESSLLYPNPCLFMNRPYDIFDWLVSKKLLTPKQIDTWMVEKNARREKEENERKERSWI